MTLDHCSAEAAKLQFRHQIFTKIGLVAIHVAHKIPDPNPQKCEN